MVMGMTGVMCESEVGANCPRLLVRVAGWGYWSAIQGTFHRGWSSWWSPWSKTSAFSCQDGVVKINELLLGAARLEFVADGVEQEAATSSSNVHDQDLLSTGWSLS